MKLVNRDYLCVLRKHDNLVKFVQEPIDRSFALESALKTALENPNMSVLDLQDIMMMEFKEGNRPHISYLSPYGYSSSYVNGVMFPREITYVEYKEELENETTEAGKENLMKQLKERYYRECIMYIDAYNYKAKLSLREADHDNVMYSKESIGWTNYEYRVNNDVKIYINTNFGYGYSSYFTLGLNYKGIDILPYSRVVNYYHADMRDILSFLRNYSTRSESWNLAFDFVEETANLAALDPDKFCDKFLKNEINSMVAGLADAVNNPEAFLNKFSTKTSRDNDSGFITVRAYMNDLEKSKYKAYPYEMSIAFMAEKIENAIMLLRNLQSLSSAYQPAKDAIMRVKEIAITGLSKLEKCASKIIPQVNQLRESLNALDTELDKLSPEYKIHKETISSLVEERNKKGESTSFYMVESEYKRTHADYTELCDKKKKLDEKREKVAGEIKAILDFLDIITSSIKIIEEVETSTKAQS